MIKYNVRSRQLVDVVNDIKDKKIIISPYFQRKMVWRTIHKIDFIKTILIGFPFPEIFIARGDLDIERMTTTSCIVDGQQRLNSIIEYINDKYEVDGKVYSKLQVDEKEKFLKYEIAIIELDMKHDDPQIKDIFKRLNRTFYSLSNIEKISSEFAPSEFMLVAKLLSKELDIINNNKEILGTDLDFDLEFDPNIPREFIKWANGKSTKNINKLIIESGIFSSYEISRQVHLNFMLNILGIILTGFFNRNIDRSILEQYANNFKLKDEIVDKLDNIASIILRLKLRKDSYWLNKANIFSLIIAFYNNYNRIILIGEKEIKKELEYFEKDIPQEYSLSAKEGVNNKKERLTRNKYIENLINIIDDNEKKNIAKSIMDSLKQNQYKYELDNYFLGFDIIEEKYIIEQSLDISENYDLNEREGNFISEEEVNIKLLKSIKSDMAEGKTYKDIIKSRIVKN